MWWTRTTPWSPASRRNIFADDARRPRSGGGARRCRTGPERPRRRRTRPPASARRRRRPVSSPRRRGIHREDAGVASRRRSGSPPRIRSGAGGREPAPDAFASVAGARRRTVVPEDGNGTSGGARWGRRLREGSRSRPRRAPVAEAPARGFRNPAEPEAAGGRRVAGRTRRRRAPGLSPGSGEEVPRFGSEGSGGSPGPGEREGSGGSPATPGRPLCSRREALQGRPRGFGPRSPPAPAGLRALSKRGSTPPGTGRRPRAGRRLPAPLSCCRVPGSDCRRAAPFRPGPPPGGSGGALPARNRADQKPSGQALSAPGTR